MTPRRKSPALRRNHGRWLLATGFGLLYLLWNYAGIIIPGAVDGLRFGQAYSQLDGSWILGLNWASFLHLPWLGNSLVWNYGPLYYLNGWLMGEFHPTWLLLTVQLGTNLFFALSFAHIFSLFLRTPLEGRNTLVALAAALLLLLQRPNIELVPLIATFVLLPVVLDLENEKQQLAAAWRSSILAVAGLLFALMPLVKLSHLYESLLLVLLVGGLHVARKRYVDAGLLGLSFLLSTSILWLAATGQSLTTLLPFVAARLDLIAGYSEGMMTGAYTSRDAQLATLFILYGIALLGGLTYIAMKRRPAWFVAWLLPMIPLLLAFKNIFVRYAGRGDMVLPFLLFSVIHYIYLLEIGIPAEVRGRTNANRRLPFSHVLTLVLGILVVSAMSFQGWKIQISNDYFGLPRLFDRKSYNQVKDRQFIRDVYNLDPAFAARLDPTLTTDIIPRDIALLFAYDLRWHPRPVIQSYQAYTAGLDDLDATFFQGPDAPQQLIYSLFAIDGRYGVFDTPSTFRAILGQYRFDYASPDGRYALLLQSAESRRHEWKWMEGERVHLGDEIRIPRASNAHVFMTADVRLTWLGRLVTLLYKPPPLRVEIKTRDGEMFDHRLIRSTAANGMLVSKHLATLADLQAVLEQNYTQNIKWLRVLGNPWIYSDSISVNFYELPFGAP